MTFIGFDPGGAGKFGCAVLRGKRSACATVDSVDAATRWAAEACEGSTLAAAGLDTLLFWQTTPAGWRSADEYLRRRYPGSKNSVISSNGLYGSMSVQGATLALRLRELWLDIVLTETHPKVLWAHMDTGFEYPRDSRGAVGAVGWLERAAGTALAVRNKHEFDAALSAWAAIQGYEGAWTRDLTSERASEQTGDDVRLVSPTHYFWPD